MAWLSHNIIDKESKEVSVSSLNGGQSRPTGRVRTSLTGEVSINAQARDWMKLPLGEIPHLM